MRPRLRGEFGRPVGAGGYLFSTYAVRPEESAAVGEIYARCLHRF